jgi:UDP-N-acetylglucosamine 1-carboxyvinyltransferase
LDLYVNNKVPLSGEISVSSSKNAILPILAASLLTEEEVQINRIPNINDVKIITELIYHLGVDIKNNGDSLSLRGEAKEINPEYELVRQIRASFLVMGPLLARHGKVKIALPGGCAIGTRPIDLHLKGFEALGANINFKSGDIIATSSKLRGNHIYLDFPSVGATENIMMAAALAEGVNSHINPAIILKLKPPNIGSLALTFAN